MRLLMLSGDRQVPAGGRGPFWEMLRWFSEHFERIDVLHPRIRFAPGKAPIRQVHGNVHCHTASCGRTQLVRNLVRRGEQLITEHGHSLITSHDYGLFANGRAAANLNRRTGVPFLSEIHHVPGYPAAISKTEAFERFLTLRYLRWARDKAAAFRAVNAQELAPLLEQLGVPKHKILVLGSLYINLQIFRPAKLTPAQTAPTNQAKWDVIYAGRFVANKRINAILQATWELKQAGFPIRVLLVGQGPLETKLCEQVTRLGLESLVEFQGWTDSPDDLAELYRNSRMVVCASSCEGGPRVTVEAMACGIPAVSTPVGMMAELLKDGTCGILADFDCHNLAACFRRVLDDPLEAHAMGLRAHQRVQRFEASGAVQAYARGLHQLASHHANQ